jgi:hypothetical protein
MDLMRLVERHVIHITSTGGFAEMMPNWLQKIAEKETEDPSGRFALYINPAAIPSGIGLYVGVDVSSPDNFNFGEDLVVASQQCTGLDRLVLQYVDH